MSYNLPNAADTSGTGSARYRVVDQAEPDAVDFEILGNVGRSGVVSGCAVSGTGTAHQVTWTAGSVMVDGASHPVATGNLTLGTPANRSFFLIVARLSGGVVNVVSLQGNDDAVNPYYPPSVSTNTSGTLDFTTDVVLAAVYKDNADTLIDSASIVDKRVFIKAGTISNQGTTAPQVGTGATGELYFGTGVIDGLNSGVYVKGPNGWVNLSQNVGPQMPVGGMVGWPSTASVPEHFLKLDGSVVTKAEYPELAEAWGITASSFSLPDLRDRVPMGASGTVAVGSTGGVKDQTAPLAAHDHTVGSHSHSFSATSSTAPNHSHGDGSLSTIASGSHEHSGSSLDISGDGYHDHTLGGALVMHQRDVGGTPTPNARPGGALPDAELVNAGAVYYESWYDLPVDKRGPVFGNDRVIDYVAQASAYEDFIVHGVKYFHSITGVGHTHAVKGNTGSGGSHSHTISGSTANAGTHSHTVSGTTGSSVAGNTGSSGSGGTFDNRPPYLGVDWIVRAKSGDSVPAGTSLYDEAREEVVTLELSGSGALPASQAGASYFRMPWGATLTGVKANRNGTNSNGSVTIDVNEDGASVLSTKLTIDVDEDTSVTAATPAVISDALIADDALITVDVDSANTSDTGPLTVTLYFSRTT